MTVIISGTDGVSDVDGTAGTPALRGTDANTGIFFGADQVGVATNGVERVEFGNSETVFNDGGADVDFRVEGDSDANLFFVDASADAVGIGTTTMTSLLNVASASNQIASRLTFTNAAPAQAYVGIDRSGNSNNMIFGVGTHSDNAQKMTIDSSGNLLVGTTSVPNTGAGTNSTIVSNKDYSGAFAQIINSSSTSGTQFFIEFGRGSSECGKITSTGTNSTTYATSSDYRLKHDIVPMTGALAKVAQLKPCTYKWNVDDSTNEGFIAHELAEVCPAAVSGEKDAVNEDGSIKPQGIDTSFLVATLTAAIQELKAINDAQAQTIESLTARVAALEAQ